jgi:hypothetical protein
MIVEVRGLAHTATDERQRTENDRMVEICSMSAIGIATQVISAQ